MLYHWSIVCLAYWLLPQVLHAEDATFDSNGVKIRYVTEGTGEAVVLIHGWMGEASMWGRDLAGKPRLKRAEGFRLIALDCRGHGQSDKPHEVEKYGVELAADVVRLLDHLKIEKAHLVGYSSGSFIAGKVAAMHPDRVLSIVYGGQAPLVTEARTSTGSTEVDVFAKAVDEGKDLGAYIQAITPAGGKKPSDSQARAIAKMLYGGKDVKAFAAAGRSFPKLEVTAEQLKKCQAPVLFIHGGNESDHVKERVAVVRQVLGRGEVKVVDGGDHVTTLVQPAFGATVLEFLRTGKVK